MGCRAALRCAVRPCTAWHGTRRCRQPLCCSSGLRAAARPPADLPRRPAQPSPSAADLHAAPHQGLADRRAAHHPAAAAAPGAGASRRALGSRGQLGGRAGHAAPSRRAALAAPCQTPAGAPSTRRSTPLPHLQLSGLAGFGAAEHRHARLPPPMRCSAPPLRLPLPLAEFSPAERAFYAQLSSEVKENLEVRGCGRGAGAVLRWPARRSCWTARRSCWTARQSCWAARQLCAGQQGGRRRPVACACSLRVGGASAPPPCPCCCVPWLSAESCLPPSNWSLAPDPRPCSASKRRAAAGGSTTSACCGSCCACARRATTRCWSRAAACTRRTRCRLQRCAAEASIGWLGSAGQSPVATAACRSRQWPWHSTCRLPTASCHAPAPLPTNEPPALTRPRARSWRRCASWRPTCARGWLSRLRRSAWACAWCAASLRRTRSSACAATTSAASARPRR